MALEQETQTKLLAELRRLRHELSELRERLRVVERHHSGSRENTDPDR